MDTKTVGTSRAASERGAAIIESAIILLTFLIILFGIMEAGRLMNVQQILTDAAREGARFAVAPISQTSTLPTNAQIQAVVDGFLSSGGISSSTVTIQNPVYVTLDGWTTEYTRVRVDVQYQPIIGALFFSSSLTLKGEALMRNETSP